MDTIFRQFEMILYRLKRNFGVPISLYHYDDQTIDLETGAVDRDHTKVTIRQAIVVTEREFSQWKIDLEELSNHRFNFDKSRRIIIIDGRDISIEIEKQDHIEYDGSRWELDYIERLVDGKGYLLRVVAIPNAELIG